MGCKHLGDELANDVDKRYGLVVLDRGSFGRLWEQNEQHLIYVMEVSHVKVLECVEGLHYVCSDHWLGYLEKPHREVIWARGLISRHGPDDYPDFLLREAFTKVR
jgi:hypothetical protein